MQKLWNLCDLLRDDGINYSDYVTELVLLLFIKMVHENTEAEILNQHTLPRGYRWTDLKGKSSINLLDGYKTMLLALSTGKRIEIQKSDKAGVDDKTVEVVVYSATINVRQQRQEAMACNTKPSSITSRSSQQRHGPLLACP